MKRFRISWSHFANMQPNLTGRYKTKPKTNSPVEGVSGVFHADDKYRKKNTS